MSFWFPYTQVICVYFITTFVCFLLACFILNLAVELSMACFAFRCEKGMAVARGPEPGGPWQTADCFGPQQWRAGASKTKIKYYGKKVNLPPHLI